MAPLFLEQMISLWPGPVVSDGAIGIILLVSAHIRLQASRLPVHRCGGLGMALGVIGNALRGLVLGLAFRAIAHAREGSEDALRVG